MITLFQAKRKRKRKIMRRNLDRFLELDPSPLVGSILEPYPGPLIGIGYETNKTNSNLEPGLELEPSFINGSGSGSGMVLAQN